MNQQYLVSYRTWRYIALCCYACMLIAVTLTVLLGGPKRRGLYETFAYAGECFFAGKSLYPEKLRPEHDQFRYTPLAAAMFTPFSFMPYSIGAVAWRWLQAVAYFFAVRAFAKQFCPTIPWPCLVLGTLPLITGGIYNAQVNAIMAACMIAGVVCFAQGRYTAAALLLALAGMFKIYPIALGFLIMLIEPKRFAWRYLLALLIVAFAPYLLHSRECVDTQYSEFFTRLMSDDRTDKPIHLGYYDFQKILRIYGLHISLKIYRVCEVIAGLGFAAFLLWGRRRWQWSRIEQIAFAAHLGFIWCTFFGPATETETYTLLAISGAFAIHFRIPATSRSRYVGNIAYAMLASIPVALWFPPVVSAPVRAVAPQAHAAIILWLYFTWLWVNRITALGATPTYDNQAASAAKPPVN